MQASTAIVLCAVMLILWAVMGGVDLPRVGIGEGSARRRRSSRRSSHEESLETSDDCLPAEGTTVHQRFMQALADLNSIHLPGSRGIRVRKCPPPNSTLHERFMQALAETDAWKRCQSRSCSGLVFPSLAALLALFLSAGLCFHCGVRGWPGWKAAPPPCYPEYELATEGPGIIGSMRGWWSCLSIGNVIGFFSPWRVKRREVWDDFSATDPFDRPLSPTVSEASDTAREDAEREAVLSVSGCTKVDGISDNEVVATLLADVNNVHDLGPPPRVPPCDKGPAAAGYVGGDARNEALRRRKVATAARPFSVSGSSAAVVKAALALYKFRAHE
ncbi:uncharacterized protein LOC144107425 [Amblyomma americanum]